MQFFSPTSKLKLQTGFKTVLSNLSRVQLDGLKHGKKNTKYLGAAKITSENSRRSPKEALEGYLKNMYVHLRRP